MPVITESNITLNFPDSNFFRFGSCPGYSALSGNYFKEMDACWFDTDNNIFWIIELKDYSKASVTSPESIENISSELVKKSIDSLCMLLSSKHSYPYSNNLNPCFPVSILNTTAQFKFITIIHCDIEQKPVVQLINEKFKNKFKPYADLFEISHYSVAEHSIAIRIIPGNLIQ